MNPELKKNLKKNIMVNELRKNLKKRKSFLNKFKKIKEKNAGIVR
jgi:hypothetical protein